MTCNPIKTKEECEKAARQLGLSDIRASYDGTYADPPYCYIEGSGDTQKLKFNEDGANTGLCGDAFDDKPEYLDRCLCQNDDGSGYTLVETSDINCTRIKTKDKCEEAARQLGLTDVDAYVEIRARFDPPYCYIEGKDETDQALKFNKYGVNTGACGANNNGSIDKCLCQNSHTESSIFPGPPLVCFEGLCRQYNSIDGKRIYLFHLNLQGFKKTLSLLVLLICRFLGKKWQAREDRQHHRVKSSRLS